MSNSIYSMVVSAAGASPNVTGSRKKTIHNWLNLLSGMASGSRVGSGNGYAKIGTAQATGTFTVLSSLAAADTVTVNGVDLTAEQERATGTAAFSTIVAGNLVVLNGVTFTARVSPTTTNDGTSLEFALGANDGAAATNLAAKVNAATSALISGLITATASSSTVTFRAVAIGTAANSYTLTRTGSPITVSNTTLLGGLARSNNKFDVSPGATTAQNAAEIALCINSSSTSLVSGHVAATSAAAIVTVTSLFPGIQGNSVTIANSAHATASGARLTGGTTTQFTF